MVYRSNEILRATADELRRARAEVRAWERTFRAIPMKDLCKDCLLKIHRALDEPKSKREDEDEDEEHLGSL